MAFDVIAREENLTVNAQMDMSSGLIHFGVQAHAAGVLVSGTVTSGQVYVLCNKPNSGQAVSAAGPGAVAKAKAGGTITLGAWITAAASGYFVTTNSWADKCGTALEAVSSGGIFALRLI